MGKIKGFQKNCCHETEDYTQYLVSPLANNVKNFTRIVDYFQYHAPQIDCIHSVAKIVDEENQKQVFDTLMKVANAQNRNNFIQRIQPNSFELYNLEGNIICIKCSRMVCRKKKDETDLSALLRHLRNAFAHGRTYIKKTSNQTYIVLEDYDPPKDKNKNPKLTAKIVTTKSQLEKWKAILENEVEI